MQVIVLNPPCWQAVFRPWPRRMAATAAAPTPVAAAENPIATGTDMRNPCGPGSPCGPGRSGRCAASPCAPASFGRGAKPLRARPSKSGRGTLRARAVRERRLTGSRQEPRPGGASLLPVRAYRRGRDRSRARIPSALRRPCRPTLAGISTLNQGGGPADPRLSPGSPRSRGPNLLAMYDAAAEAIECIRALAEAAPIRSPKFCRAEPWSRNGRISRPATSSIRDPQPILLSRTCRGRARRRRTRPLSHFRAAETAFSRARTVSVPDEAPRRPDRLDRASCRRLHRRVGPPDPAVHHQPLGHRRSLVRRRRRDPHDDRFDITVDAPSPDLNRWLTAVVRLFRPQITDLIHARDAVLVGLPGRAPGARRFRGSRAAGDLGNAGRFLAQIAAIEAAVSDVKFDLDQLMSEN